LLERAAEFARLAEENDRLRRQLSYQGVFGKLIGSSSIMQQVFTIARQVAPSNASVLIVGESGTGKELLARAIHQMSPRARGPFVAINCASLSEASMESELFGQEGKGATERYLGCFELAQAGTLLLDEIGDLPLEIQAKLLRVLEDSRVRRLGSHVQISVDVRIIASTNKQPEELMSQGRLREDLYYRLNVFQIQLPPLREREGDIPVLVEALIEDLNQKHGTRVAGAGPEVLERFRQYRWPGNVRELRNTLERAVIIAGEGQITVDHLPQGLNFTAGLLVGSGTSRQVAVLRPGITMNDAERALIELTLRHTRNNKTIAAELLGISLKTLFNKLKEYHGAEDLGNVETLRIGPNWSWDRTIFGTPIQQGEWARVFVLMPFDPALQPVFEKHIRSVTDELGLTCKRADDIYSPRSSIVQDIWSAIHHADVVIADCTGKNPNVFYEIGIAHTLGKETILIAQSIEHVPFDLRHLRILTYVPIDMEPFKAHLRTTLRVLNENRASASGN
jgi:DNA-binding NtrC family response regulator